MKTMNGGKKMKRTQLPKELVEDYKSKAKITDLCCKYGLAFRVVKNQLMEMGLTEKPVWGGRREGCGRKKRRR